MSTEATQDGTENFVVVTDDTPVIQAEAQADVAPEGQASPEEQSTEAKEKAGPEGKADESKGSGDTKTGDDATAETAKPKRGPRFQKRIDQLAEQKRIANSKAEASDTENVKLKAKIAELEGKKEQKAESKEPAEGDYETYDDYLKAVDAFDDAKEAVPAEERAADKSPADDKQESNDVPALTESQETAMAIIGDKVDEANDKPDDFEAIALDPGVPVTGEMLEALAECDDPAKVMYHLGKNKDLAAEIAAKTPVQVAREIAKLDMTVNVAPAKPTKTTLAPEPISPVRGSDVLQKSIGEMDFAEYEAHMNKIERGR